MKSYYSARLAISLAAFSAMATWGQVSAAPTAVKPAIEIKAEPFASRDVRLLEGPFKDAMLRDQAYLLSLDPDRLLHMFRITAGLPSTAQPYGGWEAPKIEVRGHSLGHYLSACSEMYSATGDQRFKDRVNTIVAALAQCQDAMPKQGFHAGYLSAFPESFIDRVEKGQPVWAPWYTLHKIMAGLLDANQLCENPQALEVLVKMADWVQFRVDHLSESQMQASLQTEFGGMNEVLANLYGVTGNPNHLKMAKAFDHKFVFDPLAKGEDHLTGLHANTQIPKIIGAAREYELTGDARYGDIAKFFWRQVAIDRAYVIGGHSDHEFFFPVEQFSKHLSPETAECCNTYNMLKLTRHLFAWEPSAKTMDFFERALFNHILASQDPVKGMFVYLMSLKPGHFKTYSLPEDSFWCCVGTGMENHAKYNEAIYSFGENSLYVNLFLASELKWKAKGLTVRQTTRFPEEDTTRLEFQAEAPVQFTVWFRHPAWATQGASVRINGQAHPLQSAPGSYVPILREWRKGDTLEIRLPMSLTCEKMPDDATVTAFLYGPVVLAGKLGTDGMPSPYAANQTDQVNVPSPEVKPIVGETEAVLRSIKPVSGSPLTFRMASSESEITLIPFYKLHHERYSVYWSVLSQTQFDARKEMRAAAEAKRKALEARIIDRIYTGEPQAETDHGMVGERTNSGGFDNHNWRDANDGGWFSYRMKVIPGQPAELQCTYWGSDGGGREFDIIVDGKTIATQTLNNNHPGEFFEVSYPIGAELTRDKSQITIRFQAHSRKRAGGLFGCSILKPAM